MPFLERSDYLPLIKDAQLVSAIEEQFSILLTAENVAMAKVKSYLMGLYDVQAAFATHGDERNAQLVDMVVNIVLYQIYQRVPRFRGENTWQKAYEETLTFLERVADGSVQMDLPAKLVDPEDPESGAKTIFRWGSKEQRSHRL